MPDLSHVEPSLHPLAVPIEHIKADPANTRKHDAANLQAIRASLAAFGQQKPIVIDAQGVCLAGNGTLAAARALGWTHIAAIRTSLAGAAARAYSIADNRTTDLSAWNEMALAQALAALQNDDAFDHALTGFSDQAIDEVVERAMGLDASAKDEPPEVALKECHQLLVACNDEADQRDLYERLEQEGYPCRVLTL